MKLSIFVLIFLISIITSCQKSETHITASCQGKCTGKSNCTACKNCKYCMHCNSGGSCGMCR